MHFFVVFVLGRRAKAALLTPDKNHNQAFLDSHRNHLRVIVSKELVNESPYLLLRENLNALYEHSVDC